MNIWKLFIGLLFILGGGLFILANLGIVPTDVRMLINDYWPALIILFSPVILIDSLLKKHSARKRFNRIYLSFAVLVTGIILLNQNLSFVNTAGVELWEILLALLLVYIGIKLIFFKSFGVKVTVDSDGNRKHNHFHADFKEVNDEDTDEEPENGGDESADKNEEAQENKKNNKSEKRRGVFISHGGSKHEQFIGEIRLGDGPWSPESGSYTINVGDMHIDFTTAMLDEGETVMDLSGWVGDITVIIPEDLAVDISATTNIGDVVMFNDKRSGGVSQNTVRYVSEGYKEAEKKLKIDASLNIGEITVKKV